MVSGVPAFQGHHINQEVQMADNFHPGIKDHSSVQQFLLPFMFKQAQE